MVRLLVLVAMVGVGVHARAAAQSSRHPDVVGTWKFDLKQGDKTAPRTVIVRPDSSASYGKETVRWRFKGADSLMLALGGEWVGYHLKLKGNRMVLSGGDLTEAVTFERIGPPTPRPDSVAVPPDPDTAPS
ncbi:MAG TPA: hypothetical protein VFK09_03710 [Gemmatimonadales bacterium]|jgi:hypothetical protein|nr:hypothetical protein [Gemmatimonadales bacterium]